MKINLNIRGEKQAEAVAQYCKRITFDDAYLRACGDTTEERKSAAYLILEGLWDVQKSLSESGISPR